MKALIWILCFFVATILNTLLGYATGVKVGYLIFYFIVYFVAKKLCDKWDEHKNKKQSKTVSVADDEGNNDKINFCRKCGEPLIDSSKFCRKCGTEVIELKLTNIPDTQEFKVIIFDTGAGKMRTEMRKVDVKKFPPEKFSDNNTYYAVETMKEGKKVRIYCTKNNWEKQIENNKAT